MIKAVITPAFVSIPVCEKSSCRIKMMLLKNIINKFGDFPAFATAVVFFFSLSSSINQTGFELKAMGLFFGRVAE